MEGGYVNEMGEYIVPVVQGMSMDNSYGQDGGYDLGEEEQMGMYAGGNVMSQQGYGQAEGQAGYSQTMGTNQSYQDGRTPGGVAGEFECLVGRRLSAGDGGDWRAV